MNEAFTTIDDFLPKSYNLFDLTYPHQLYYPWAPISYLIFLFTKAWPSVKAPVPRNARFIFVIMDLFFFQVREFKFSACYKIIAFEMQSRDLHGPEIFSIEGTL